MRKLSHKEIVNRQSVRKQQPRLPVTIILNNIRSLHNVGSIFRTADGAGVEKIWLCGITGTPPNAQLAKTALGAEDSVPWEYSDNILSIVQKLKKENYKIVLLEQAEGSVEYSEYVPESPVCLIVGNEIKGISEELISSSDVCLEIEMMGIKNSLNVSVAFGIIVYHLRQFLKDG